MVLRRFTPPTCTLEIQAKDSPLSRWAGQPVLKHLRFELSFDDPRQPEDRRVTIRGNRAQLESLCEAVSVYVQDFLQQSPRSQPVAHQMPVGEPMMAAAAPTQAATILSPPESPTPQTFVPYIQSRGLLSHDLFLGHLATEETGPVVTLSALQLFDLATALDEYNAELVALPTLNRTQWLKNPPIWTRTAAIFLLGVGITAATLKLLQPSPTIISSAPAPTPLPSTPAPVPGTEVLPVPTTPPTTGVPTPPALSSPSPTPTGSPSSILLSPAPVTTPTPFSARSPGVVVVPRNPPGNSNPVFSNLPPIQQRSAPEGRAIFQPPPPSNFPPIPKPPAEQPKSAIRNNLPFEPIPSSGGVTAPRIGQSGSAPGSIASSSEGANQSASPNAPGIPAAPPPLPNLPSLASLPAESSAPNNSELSPGATRGSVAPPAAKRGSESASDRAQTSSDRAQNDRLFDTIPQVAQVRDYFQQQWKPPADLTQPLQYYLRLNPDGSIERIRPLGELSVKYIDRTGMPVPGKPFVSPIEGERNAHIRVVLGPDGKVETFQEP